MYVGSEIDWLAMGFNRAYDIKFLKVYKFWQSSKKIIKPRRYDKKSLFSRRD
jgi:hypothetical protein